jgi:hypothetical protein
VSYVLAVIAIVVLASPFGAVEGRAVDDENGLTVEITIEVDETFEAVLIRPFSSFEEIPPTALASLDDDTWGGFVTFPTAENWLIVFDAHDSQGTATRSESMSLTDIGVDPLVVAGEPVPLPGRGLDSTTWWLIGAVTAALAALAALAWWTFAGDSKNPGALDSSASHPEASDPGEPSDQPADPEV